MKLKLLIITLVCLSSIFANDLNFNLDYIEDYSQLMKISCKVDHTFRVSFQGEFLDTKPIIINEADTLKNFSMTERKFYKKINRTEFTKKGFAYYIFQCKNAGKFDLDIEINLPIEKKLFRFEVSVDI